MTTRPGSTRQGVPRVLCPCGAWHTAHHRIEGRQEPYVASAWCASCTTALWVTDQQAAAYAGDDPYLQQQARHARARLGGPLSAAELETAKRHAEQLVEKGWLEPEPADDKQRAKEEAARGF